MPSNPLRGAHEIRRRGLVALRLIHSHPWDVSLDEAREIERRLSPRVEIRPLAEIPRTVAGVHVRVRGDMGTAAVVVLLYPDLRFRCGLRAGGPISFPYAPGFLSFREGPVILAAMEQLSDTPDVLLFGAHGIAHPRRMGLATHIGVSSTTPTIGCARTRLFGVHAEPSPERGSWAPLMDQGEIIGAVVRTRTAVRPVYVSVGHRVDMDAAIRLVLGCSPRYRLPEPLRCARMVAAGERLPLEAVC